MLTDAASHRNKVLVAVAAHHGVTVEELRGQRRWAKLVRPRHIAIWLLRRAGLSFPAIGRVINRDNSTVQYAVRAIEKLREEDEDFAAELVWLEELAEVSHA